VLGGVLAAAALGAWLVVSGDGQRRLGPTVVGRWLPGLARREASAWLGVAALVGIVHWVLVGCAVPLQVRRGSQLVDRLTAWPQLLTGRSDPDAAEWNRAAHWLRGTIARYPRHPWTGRYLLVLGWIEASRLGHDTRARLILSEAEREHGSVRANAPPGWPAAGTVGGIARAVRRSWGTLLESGSVPG
jgi:hypothetical protein